MDTIFALATAAGKAGVAVICISGPDAVAALGRFNPDTPPPRIAAVRVLRMHDGSRLDQALVLVFDEARSFTGEETVELHCHGSPAVVHAVLRELGQMPGLRGAEMGEFTRRALENDRLDIAEVEGLADLVEAETEAQRRQAMRVFSGELGARVEGWRRDLIRAAALLEATIDFADEEVPVDVSEEVLALLQDVMQNLRSEIAGVDAAERVRAGFEVAIVGAPNVGKSTLLNALAGRRAAITSELAGTTRDVIEVRMDLGGLPVTLLDTAGLRETSDQLENLGIELARDRAIQADLRVFLIEEDNELPLAVEPDDIVLLAKADLKPGRRDAISGVTGEGVNDLIARITQVLQRRAAGIGVATRLRHKQAMATALDNLSSATIFASQGEEKADLAAEEVRSAIRALDSLVGRVDIENILDEIFASFCIGK